MNSIRLLYQLQEYRILLWKSPEGHLAFSIDKSIGFPQKLKEQVTNYKAALLFLLEYNDIYSEEQAKNCGFYKIPESLNKQVLQTIQKGMYLQTTLEAQKATYTVPLLVLFKQANASVLKQAIQQMVNKHPILRMQIVDNFCYEILPENSLTIKESMIGSQQITKVCEQQAQRAFAMDGQALIHVELMAISDTQDYLVNLTHHHMLSDAYSADLMINELVAHYQEISQGIVANHERIFHYFDYTCFQEYALHTEPYQQAIRQLAQQLDNAEPLNLLARNSILEDNSAGFYEFTLDKLMYQKTQQLAFEHEVSVYSLLLTALYQVLSTYSGGQTNFPITLTVANRLPEMNQVIGPFINTLPLIPEYKKDETVLYHVKKIHESISFLNAYHQINMDVLAQHLKRSHEDIPALLHVLFTFHNFKQVLKPEVEECAQAILLPDCYEKFGISIIAKQCHESLSFTVTYLNNRYDKDYIKYLFDSFIHVLTKYVKGAWQQTISSIDLLDEHAWSRIVGQFNQTLAPFPQQKTINQLFEEQVARTPEHLAVVYEQTRLTYRELNSRANQLAYYLRERYVLKPDKLVALCLDRSEHMIISILAILKTGAAYVPIAPDFPQARIEYLVQDTQTPFLLTTQKHQSCLTSFLTLPIHAVDETNFLQQLTHQSCANLPAQHGSEHLAYVIYTSGTTGQPKGVMLEHRGVVNRIHWMNKQYPLNENDKIIQKTPYVFDVSVWELLWAHWYGACLVFAKPEGHKDADYLYKLMRQEDISIAHFVPSMLGVFMDDLDLRSGEIPSLRMIFCSGEALKLAQVRQVHALLANTEIHNLYGPTEASIDVLYADCNDKNISEIVIGKPIDNTTAYILDEHMHPLPFFALGELYIGGVGLARGYLNRTELTQARFVANPFQSIEQKAVGYNNRLYKTGDIVSLSPDGSMTYHGRNDHQVKLRGHRIELGEIEQLLLEYPGVKQSVVVVKQHAGQVHLCGYYVSHQAQDEPTLLGFLSSRLPEYMVPTRLVHLAALPLTANGKLDLKNLPEPEAGHGGDYALPTTQLEQQLRAIWSEVLGLKEEALSVHDDFFRLGGDSIISIQLISRLRQRLQVQVSVKDLFSCRTIRGLHTKLLECSALPLNAAAQGEQGLLSGAVDLLPIQRWFFAQDFVKGMHWNQSFLIKTPMLDVARLRSCLQQLVLHHDAFRLRFREQAGVITQYYEAHSVPVELQLLDVSSLDRAALEAQMTLWQSGFNWAVGPLYCFAYLHGYADGSSRIYVAMHHLLVDAVSWRILADDLHTLYEGRSLGDKGSSCRQWASALRDYAQHHEKERAYWQTVLADLKELPALERQVKLSVAELELDEALTCYLLRQANSAYHTQINDLLLTALAYALKELSGEAVHHVTLEGHGREDIVAAIDGTRTVGWLTSLYPVRLELGRDLGHSIKRIKDTVRHIPNKGIGYGALVGYATSKMPVISFNYLGQFEQQSQFWHITDEYSGQAMHPDNQEAHRITCFGGIHQGRLRMIFRTQLHQALTDSLALAYKQQLLMIIEHQRSLTRSFLTLSDIHHCLSARSLDKVQQDQELEGIYLANSLHQGFIYHSMSQGQKDEAYRMQIVWSYACEVKIELLQQAWRLAQQRYPSLRLRFLIEEELVQVIDKVGHLHWQFIDLSQDKEKQERKIQQLIQEDRQKSYDLTQGSLFRLKLIKQDATHYTCIFNAHHAIIDGWSGPLLLGFVHEMYMKLLHQALTSVTVDTAYAQAQYFLQVQELENRSFWQQYVAQIEDKADLSYLLLERKKQLKLSDYKYITHQVEQTICINAERFQCIKTLSQKYGITFNAILLYAWHKVIRIYGNGTQTVVGTIVSGRNLPIDYVEHSVGLYINTLPMIVNHSQHDDLSVLDALRHVQEMSNEISQRSAMSLAKLQSQGERLFDCLFMYGNYPNLAVENPEKYLPFNIQSTFEKRDYPLSLAADEEENQLRIKLTYASELFDSSQVMQLLTTLNYLLDQIAGNPLQRVAELNYVAWPLPEPSNLPGLSQTFMDYFEKQVSLYPERTALVYEQTQLNYAELNQRANQLAHYIRQQIVPEKDSLIAVCLEKNEYLIIALLAVLKAGSAYLPIDPAMPKQRMLHVLKDSQAKLVLTCKSVKHTFAHAILLDDPKHALVIAQQATSNLNASLKPADLAYVIYTSGTTGHPKGVMIEHGTFLQTLVSMQAKYFPDRKPLNTYSMTHCVFDIFGLEYGLPLLTGGKVELGHPLFNTLDCRSFDFIQMTPSVCELKLDALQHCDATTFLIGGEALAAELLAKALTKAHAVIHVYGPTETTIWSTAKVYFEHDTTPLSIGRPLHFESVYVLDDYLTPMPIGAVGTLYIGGACLARGYLNQPDLTAQHFITHPLYKRLYKTGDLAKWLPNGELAFIGRNDFQVKIRGHRIELGEIESVLRLHPQVKQAVVLECEQNLAAYFTGSEGVVEMQLHAFLKEQLPDYMLPQTYMQLEQFPLTVNGKLDRKALPKPNLTQRAGYALPSTAQEKLLAGLWEEVLGISNVGVEDNFFDLGGHSISLIKLFSKLPEAIKAQITVLDLFKFPSISALLGYLAKDKNSHEFEQKKIRSSLKEDDIAIIGMAGRFPGADDLETFWLNLQTSKEAITYYSREELFEQGLDHALVDHPNYVKAQSKLSDIKCFDAEFFGYTAAEAEIMDPQHRLLMQCAWHALEDANYNPHHYAGDIGLFAGCGQNNYFNDHVVPNQTHSDVSRQFQLMIHQQANFLCTKIAYKLNLTGPAITIQTACSTSLVAVHQACLALNAGDCDIALAGGVSIGQLEKQGYLYQPGLIFSPDAKCRAFDAQAQGTFEGQGVGLVVLKPLNKALVDDDFIYAVIKASAINNDGQRKIGFTAPSPQKQAEVIALAQQRAGCSPATITYIEAHGTGTALGDPIEIEGLAQAFKESSSAPNSCAIGSVKTNIGHLDVAAGIAGLIKTALCLHHKQLVPTLHYQSENSKINFADGPFYVNTILKSWVKDDCPRRAGVSAFGIGGTNAHLILEEAPIEAKQKRASPTLYPFAKTEYWLPARKDRSVAIPSAQANRLIVRDREQLISILRQLWTALLGFDSFKNHEDFFDLGGDSLAAVQLSAQLERQLGVNLQLVSLNRITIESLMTLIDKESNKPVVPQSPVVLIQPGKVQQNSEPFILIHPIGGDVYFYRDLAKALPESQTVYALRSPLLDGGTPFASIESMAAAYLNSLQAFGLKPPYILGGSSFGGAVAIEMAKQLAQSGQSIPLVALIDTPAYANLPKLMSQEEILIYLTQHGLGNLPISLSELAAQNTLEQKIAFIANRAKDTELKELLSTEFLPQFLRTWQHHGQLLQRYQPEPYYGAVLFFAHSEKIDDFPPHQEQYWQKLVHGPFKHIAVPGTHITMNAAPNVQVIADALVFELKQRYHSPELLGEVEKV